MSNAHTPPPRLPEITRAVRAADEAFEKSGGSSRDWVRECFLPALENECLEIVNVPEGHTAAVLSREEVFAVVQIIRSSSWPGTEATYSSVDRQRALDVASRLAEGGQP